MRYWVNTVSRDHVQRGAAGFTQAGHGKDTRLKRLSKGDRIVIESSACKTDGPPRLLPKTAAREMDARREDQRPLRRNRSDQSPDHRPQTAGIFRGILRHERVSNSCLVLFSHTSRTNPDCDKVLNSDVTRMSRHKRGNCTQEVIGSIPISSTNPPVGVAATRLLASNRSTRIAHFPVCLSHPAAVSVISRSSIRSVQAEWERFIARVTFASAAR